MVLERESVESQVRKKEGGGGGGEVVMDTPERNKSNQIATPISKFEVFVTDLVLKFAVLADFAVSLFFLVPWVVCLALFVLN